MSPSSGNDVRDDATCHFDFALALDAVPQTTVTQQKHSANPQQALSSPVKQGLRNLLLNRLALRS